MGSKTSKKGTGSKKKPAAGKKPSGKKASPKKAPEEVQAEIEEPKKEEPAAEPTSPTEPMADEVTAAPDTRPEPGSESGTTVPEEPHETTPESPEPAAVQVGPVRDPRIPPVGSTITRKFKGADLHVKLLEDGFEYEGNTFPSISRLAKHITGHQAVNGYAFFKLGVTTGGAGATRQAARLAGRIRKLDGLAVKMRAALAEGALALADAEAEIDEMKKKAAELQQSE